MRVGQALVCLVAAGLWACVSLSSAVAQTSIQQVRAIIDAGDATALQRLLGTGELSVRARLDDEGTTPLHLAAERCFPALVRILVDRGAQVDLPNRWNDSPYRIALVRCGPRSPTLEAFIRPWDGGAYPPLFSGSISVTDDGSRRRFELWCNGERLELGAWSVPGGASAPLSRTTCERQSTVATQAPAEKAQQVALPLTPSGPRVALIIGNSSYDATLGRLPNPANDAQKMATALRSVGFDVEVLTDADQKSMRRAIARLGQRVSHAGKGATGLFFYAGHGIQVRGANYLVPIAAALETEADVEIEAVPADAVMRQLEEAGAQTSILILDACRNLPLARANRDATRGLARMDAPNGSFIAYSTAPGGVAADGTGVNSPFVNALARELLTRGQSIETTFRKVRIEVVETTKGKQTPWDSSSLLRDFQFVQ